MPDFPRNRTQRPAIDTFEKIPCHAECHKADGGENGETLVLSAVLHGNNQQICTVAILNQSEDPDDYLKYFTGLVNVMGRHDTPGTISFQTIDNTTVRNIIFKPANTGIELKFDTGYIFQSKLELHDHMDMVDTFMYLADLLSNYG